MNVNWFVEALDFPSVGSARTSRRVRIERLFYFIFFLSGFLLFFSTFEWRVDAIRPPHLDIPHCSSKESPSVSVNVNRLFLPLCLNASSFSECVGGHAVYVNTWSSLDFIVILLQAFFFSVSVSFPLFFCVWTVFLRHNLQSHPPVHLAQRNVKSHVSRSLKRQ